MATAVRFDDDTDDDFDEKQEMLEEVQNEMMVAMLDVVQGAASACAKICLRNMVKMRKQMLVAFAEEGRANPKGKSVMDIVDSASMKKRTSFYDLMGFDREKTEIWQDGQDSDDDGDGLDDDSGDGLEAMFEAMNPKPKPAALVERKKAELNRRLSAQKGARQPRRMTKDEEEAKKINVRKSFKFWQAEEVNVLEKKVELQKTASEWKGAKDESDGEDEAPEQIATDAYAARERRLTAGAEAIADALSIMAPSEEELPRWYVEEATLLCHHGEESKFEGRAPLLDTDKVTSVRDAVRALNEGSISPPGDFCIVYSTSKEAYFLLHRTGRRAAALEALALTERGSGVLLIRVLAGHGLPGSPDDSKYVSVRVGRKVLKTPGATGDNLIWSSNSDPPFRFQVDLSMKDQQMLVLEVFQSKESVGRAEVDIQNVVNKGMCRMRVALEGGSGKIEVEASYVPQVITVSQQRLLKIIQHSEEIRKVIEATAKPAVVEQKMDISERNAEPTTTQPAAAPAVEVIQAKRSPAELIALALQIKEKIEAVEKQSVEEQRKDMAEMVTEPITTQPAAAARPRLSTLTFKGIHLKKSAAELIALALQIREKFEAIEKAAVEEQKKDMAETVAEQASTQPASAAALEEPGPPAPTVVDIHVKRSPAELIALALQIREKLKAVEKQSVEEQRKDMAEMVAEPITTQPASAARPRLSTLTLKGIHLEKSAAELIALALQIREKFVAIEKAAVEEQKKEMAETVAELAATQPVAAAALEEPGFPALAVKGIQLERSAAELIALALQIREKFEAIEKAAVEEQGKDMAETVAEPAATQLAAAAHEETGLSTLALKGIHLKRSPAQLIALALQIREVLADAEYAATFEEPGPPAPDVKAIQVKRSPAELIALALQIRELIEATEEPAESEPPAEPVVAQRTERSAVSFEETDADDDPAKTHSEFSAAKDRRITASSEAFFFPLEDMVEENEASADATPVGALPTADDARPTEQDTNVTAAKPVEVVAQSVEWSEIGEADGDGDPETIAGQVRRRLTSVADFLGEELSEALATQAEPKPPAEAATAREPAVTADPVVSAEPVDEEK